MRRSARIYGIAIVLLAALCALVGWALFGSVRGVLTVSFLDVGQGDAILIEAPSGRRALIDGGPNSGILRVLAGVLPWWERSIDVVVATHPDADHIGGLIDVLERYQVDTIVQSSVRGSTPTWDTFERAVRDEHTRDIVAQRGQVIDLGGGAYLEVLSPDRALPGAETNMACVVTRLVYGATSFMLPCDAPQAMEEYLAYLDGPKLRSDVLKPGHHGSKTSSAAIFVGFVAPEYAVLSRGCDNTYGFPHAQTLATLADFGIQVSDTCKDGTVTFVSDGKTVSRQ